MWLCQFCVDLIKAGTGSQDAMIFIEKMCCSNEHADIGGPVATVLHSSDGPTPPIATV
jgi:hypothetical protein